MFTAPSADALISIGKVHIHYYGMILAFAIFIGFFVMLKIARKYYPQINAEILYDLSPGVILGAILGARIYYVILDWSYYSKNLIEIPAIWQGGLSIHGAILGGFLCGLIYLKIKKLPILIFADIYSYGLVLGQAIGRWGNFFNSEAYGKPCDLPWKLFIPPAKRSFEYLNYQYFHPAFLYEFLCNLLIFVILFFILRKVFKNIDGAIFFSYLILYSVCRILIENLRIDSILNIFGISIAIFASVFMLLIGLVGLILVTKKGNSNEKARFN